MSNGCDTRDQRLILHGIPPNKFKFDVRIVTE